jgi:hypothetical protein
VIAQEGLLPPQQNWITSQMTLRWFDRDWKVSASGAHPGPIPQPPSGVESVSWPLSLALTDYQEYKHVG